ncbi:DNA-3-methyladenine glycosylase [Pseudalkalibacillus berkeleyi]|uniref:Putative 3-methyladenine DNA glycosylase n=1 Tax=Pseudalkalibacillus berkeleyi TaxID=1069813 RepID=A0ABS9H3G4_9BACL|nr:DNA-3-methyladenine glycosylase [Pseudalkalibacillus berkeleyi]MCF6138382.1 DNA-3-methyladenine glycosylase [Pseudalkalibacillus berkeleyi]
MTITKEFLEQPTLELARQLIGKELVHETTQGTLSGKIVEVEAYKGPEDKAAHSYGGRRTSRTEIMYSAPGHVYMFLIYGMHHCFNIVSGPIGKPEAILIRALEPIQGIELMLKNRFGIKESYLRSQYRNLTNGPGKLCKAMQLNMDLYGQTLMDNHSVSIRHSQSVDDSDIIRSPRINIDYAEEHAALPYRFHLRDHPHVSKA